MKEMRLKGRQVDEQAAYALFESCEYAVLATVNAESNTPYCIPISPVLANGFLYFHGALEGQKMDNIIKNSNVFLTCVGRTKQIPERYTMEYESAVIEGEAHLVEDREEKILALQHLCQKYAPSHMERFDAAIERSLHRTGIFRITIKAICGKVK